MRAAQLLAVMGVFRYPRHDCVGMAHRSLLEPVSASRLLHRSRRVAAVPAAHAQRWRSRQHRPVRCVLRARLGGHGAADRAAHGRIVRPGEHRRDLRLDWRKPPARSVDGCLRRRRHPKRSGGDYATAFYISGVLCVLAGTSFLTPARPPSVSCARCGTGIGGLQTDER